MFFIHFFTAKPCFQQKTRHTVTCQERPNAQIFFWREKSDARKREGALATRSPGEITVAEGNARDTLGNGKVLTGGTIFIFY